MIIKLSKTYSSIYELPTIHSVDTRIFFDKYFGECLNYNCSDICCSYGTDMDLANKNRVEKFKKEMEDSIKIPYSQWYKKEELSCEEYPTRSYVRVNAINDKCIFLNKNSRGCVLHSCSLENKIDYHELKPIICCIFPLTFTEGVLHVAIEVEEGSLYCQKDKQVTLYNGIKQELEYYWGKSFIQELDEIEIKLG